MYLLQRLNDEWHKHRYSLFKGRNPKSSLFDIRMTNNKQLVIRLFVIEIVISPVL